MKRRSLAASSWRRWVTSSSRHRPSSRMERGLPWYGQVTMVMSWASLRLKDFKKYRLWMGLTFTLGLVFMVVKTIEYGSKFEHHLYPSTDNFMATYFTMTGLHGLHVLGGMIVIGYFLGPGAKMWQSEPERFTNRVEIVGLYWHFVDLVWIFLFPLLYLF